MARQDSSFAQTAVAWIVGGLIGILLLCFFVLVSFAFHGALHLPVAGIIVAVIVGTIGLPTLILGLAVAAPTMALARAWVWPRPATDCVLGVLLAMADLAAGHVFFSHGQGAGRGLFGPLWVDMLCAATSGAIAGGAYWRLAGEPRPPYSKARRVHD
jgi:hypothetical protein